jgi:hypothetical protein
MILADIRLLNSAARSVTIGPTKSVGGVGASTILTVIGVAAAAWAAVLKSPFASGAAPPIGLTVVVVEDWSICRGVLGTEAGGMGLSGVGVDWEAVGNRV